MEEKSKALKVALPSDGDAVLQAEPPYTEEEIADDIEWLTIELDGMYWQLVDSMKPFQDKWDEGPVTAMREALMSGMAEGGGAWVEDLGDLFKGETWQKIGGWLGDVGATVADNVANYAKEQGAKLEKLLERPGETVFSWTWWAKEAEETAAEVNKTLNSAITSVSDTAQAGAQAVKMAAKVWEHREAIMNVPELIAEGKAKEVQIFVDTVIKDIDPDLYKEIRESEHFDNVLALIADHDTALTFMTYLSLTLEAMPPNFYVYIGGKAGMYIVCEVILTVLAAFLSAGVGAVARVATIGARIAVAGAKATKAGRKIEHAMRAMNAFVQSLQRFVDVGAKMQALGHKLSVVRGARMLRVQGPAKGKLTAKKQETKRQRKCRICGSTKHKTPAHTKRGCVVYK